MLFFRKNLSPTQNLEKKKIKRKRAIGEVPVRGGPSLAQEVGHAWEMVMLMSCLLEPPRGYRGNATASLVNYSQQTPAAWGDEIDKLSSHRAPTSRSCKEVQGECKCLIPVPERVQERVGKQKLDRVEGWRLRDGGRGWIREKKNVAASIPLPSQIRAHRLLRVRPQSTIYSSVQEDHIWVS